MLGCMAQPVTVHDLFWEVQGLIPTVISSFFMDTVFDILVTHVGTIGSHMRTQQ